MYRHARICSFLVFPRSLFRGSVSPCSLHCAICNFSHMFSLRSSHGNGRLISARKQTPSPYEIENRLCRVQEETCQGNFPQIPVPATAPERARAVVGTQINLTPCLYSAEKRSRVVDIVSEEVSHVCIHLRILSSFTRPKRARRS